MQFLAMHSLLLCLGLAAAEVGSSARSRAEVTPVQKVIQLLEGMLTKGKQEKHEEQVQFASFKQFCDDTTVQKQRDIKEADEKIEMLKADIQKYTADAAQLAKEIAGHDEDISVWTGDKKAATKVRELEKQDYTALHKDYSESVDALQRAIVVLKQQAYDRPQASLAQVSALKGLSLIPSDAKKAIDLFLMQDSQDPLTVSAPEANAYEFQSHGIVEILEKLLDKFIDERTAAEKQEMNTQHAYDMLMQDLTAQVEQATQDRTQKSGVRAKKLQSKADAEGDLTDTTSTRDSDQKYLDNLVATCQQKATDFESRQQLRADEIVAIQKAMEILSSSSVSGHAETYLPSLMQKRKATSLSQLRSGAMSPAQQRAVEYLREQGRHLNSRVLSALAVRASDDPFRKVKKMIKDLIVRLMEEANEEAEHKGWCDTELSTNEQTRKEKTEAVETLHAEIDQLEASIAKLTADLSELAQAVAELDAAMVEATKVRQQEKATNTQTIQDSQEAQTAVAQALTVLKEFYTKVRQQEKATNTQTVQDSQEAQTAVAQALTVLKEFYAKAAEATALVQQQPEVPEIFTSSYKGLQAENGGVVGMLEVIESDFARLEAETTAAEASAQKMYDTFMTDSKVDKAQKNKDIEHKTAKKQDETQAHTVKTADLEGTQKELDAALAYFDKLKPSCVDAGVSYDDRVTRRKEEIESLQEALRILNGEDIAA